MVQVNREGHVERVKGGHGGGGAIIVMATLTSRAMKAPIQALVPVWEGWRGWVCEVHDQRKKYIFHNTKKVILITDSGKNTHTHKCVQTK